ncbi:BlaI/MecI/CopY family transcriptional regulator [Haloferula sp. BvORR071]|uniref:BlaI/MecI/CopY family transcriptional regulator n=1 Tax=Haloferula sp. BvORR071 TaxID=1396141 RepID=UPI0006984D22|nr:BlaI/MecI/CopY family transcriptional regulator [Haloferula sp. BvORR071]
MAQPESNSTPTYPSLSRREREIVEIIHRLGTPTLSEIIAEMSDPPVRAAVRTLMNILERKGHVTHGKAGREFVYQATRSREREGGSSLKRLLSTFFKGSLKDAIACHFEESPDSLKKSELDEIADLVDRLRTDSSPPKRPPRS